MTDSRARLAGQVGERAKDIFLPDANHAVVKTVGIGLDEIRRGDGLFERRLGDLLSVGMVNVMRQSCDGLCQRLTQIALV